MPNVSILAVNPGHMFVHIPYHPTLLQVIRSVLNWQWNPVRKAWLLPDTQKHLDAVLFALLHTGLFTHPGTEEEPANSAVQGWAGGNGKVTTYGFN